MEARRRRRQLLQDVVVQSERHAGELVRRRLHARVEGLDVRRQNGGVDGAQVLLIGELDLQRVEQRDEPRVHGVARASRRAHRRDVVKVAHLLPVEFLPAVVQTLALDEGLEQRDGLLRAVQVNLGHVQVVEEEH